MTGSSKRTSILVQVAIFFLVGVCVTGILTYFTQMVISDKNVISTTETFASRVSDETVQAIKQYPSYQWLIQYWYDHKDDLDIEYDAKMEPNTKTAKKCALLQKRHPGLQLEYATTEQVEALPPKDQKLYAEIIYSWLITRVNQIKRSYDVVFLYCVLTNEACDYQFFLFSAADEGAERGMEYGQVYLLGAYTPLEDNADLRDGMRYARDNESFLAAAGDFMDYYAFVDQIGDQSALVGLTFSIEGLKTDAQKQTKTGTFFAILFQIFLAIICLLMIFVFMIVPLRKVQKNIRLYKETKDSDIITKNLAELKSHNEIMELSQDITGLAEEIDNYLNQIETITKERERISAELNVATRIQSDMLPSIFPAFPERNEFSIYATMNPAKEVGGDFYDFYLIDEDHLCMVMADVSGKGIPAALFMVIAKTLIKNRAQMGESPAQILTNVNTQLSEGNEADMFVTVWIAIVELSTGKGVAANAGHEHPVIRRAGGSFELVKYNHCPIVGAIDGLRFKEHEFQLYPEDTLFIYTDGLPEAKNKDDEMFGEERMLQVLNENHDVSLKDILTATENRALDFTGEADQFDDLTMLILQWHGPNKD